MTFAGEEALQGGLHSEPGGAERRALSWPLQYPSWCRSISSRSPSIRNDLMDDNPPPPSSGSTSGFCTKSRTPRGVRSASVRGCDLSPGGGGGPLGPMGSGGPSSSPSPRARWCCSSCSGDVGLRGHGRRRVRRGPRRGSSSRTPPSAPPPSRTPTSSWDIQGGPGLRPGLVQRGRTGRCDPWSSASAPSSSSGDPPLHRRRVPGPRAGPAPPPRPKTL